MNDNVKHLILAVAGNDTQKAKQYAKVIVSSDNTQKNKHFCSRVTNMLQSSAYNLLELPANMQNILVLEDVSASFDEKRYYLSERENTVAGEIVSMYETSKRLSEMRISYLNSLLLHGESGTGKTMFGKYLSYKLGLPFAYMNFSHAISSYLGSTAKNIGKAFDFIQNQKCVFMIDEIDAIGMQRGKEDVGEMSRIVIGLMQALDRVKNDCVIIGATNRLDMIDKALLRRFSIIHEVKVFTEEERREMALKYLEDVGVTYDIDNVKGYCETQKSQADIIVDIIRAIAKAIRFNKTCLYLSKGE